MVANNHKETGLGPHRDCPRLNPLALSATGILLDPTLGNVYTLNSVARAIISAWQAGDSPDRIQAALLERFEVDARTLTRDLGDFTRRMKWLGLAD